MLSVEFYGARKTCSCRILLHDTLCLLLCFLKISFIGWSLFAEKFHFGYCSSDMRFIICKTFLIEAFLFEMRRFHPIDGASTSRLAPHYVYINSRWECSWKWNTYRLNSNYVGSQEMPSIKSSSAQRAAKL